MREQLLKEYDQIFEKYENATFGNILKERGYVFQYDEDETNADLLFIGINPSYTEKHEGNEHYRTSYDRNVKRSYFKPFSEINQELNNAKVNYNGVYTHIDLLVFRETKQEKVDELMRITDGCGFLIEQLEIAKNRLKHISPKVIIVSNAKASELMGKNRFFNDKTGEELGIWMGLNFIFDEEFGAHKVTNIPELENSYFLFTSMLSGQRALDLGSKERLVWQVKRIFKNAYK